MSLTVCHSVAVTVPVTVAADGPGRRGIDSMMAAIGLMAAIDYDGGRHRLSSNDGGHPSPSPMVAATDHDRTQRRPLAAAARPQ